MNIKTIHTSLSIFKKSGAKGYFQTGSGLIEVMVSLLILAVGLLGMLSLQASGLNGNQRANFVTDAQLLAQDMADKIIATTNIASAPQADAYIRAGNYDGIDINKSDALNAAACDPLVVACSPAQARGFNQNEWLKSIQGSSLPSGRGVVSWADPVYTVQVMWNQERAPGAVVCTINNCFQMEVRLP